MILSAAAAIGVWYWRMKAAGDVASGIVDAANDVRLAARRFGYKQRNKTHPADSIDDARLAAAGILVAIGGMDSEFNEDNMKDAIDECRWKFDIEWSEAQEIMLFGKWIAAQCGTKDEAVRRLSKRVFKLSGMDAGPDLVEMIQKVVKSEADDKNSRVADAIAQVRRNFSH